MSVKRAAHRATPAARKRGRVRAGRSPETRAAEIQTRYIETSALLADVLENDALARQAVRGPGRLITSALTHAEAARTLRRAQAAGRLTPRQADAILRGLDTFATRCEMVAVRDDVLARAGRSFPIEPVRTLDAIHLATVELLGAAPASVTVVTRDARIRANARAMGWRTE
jgi:predicted nucleic acid-binding protein